MKKINSFAKKTLISRLTLLQLLSPTFKVNSNFSIIHTLLLGFAIVICPHAADAGTLNGSVNQTQLLNQNLTTQGTLDWAIWGYDNGGTSTSLVPNVRKNGGSFLGSLTNISNGNPLRGLGQFGNYGESTFNWFDGTPISTATDAFTGIQHNGQNNIGEGFSFTVAADTFEKTLTLYSTLHNGNAQLIANLSDGSAPAYIQNTSFGGFNGSHIYTITYAANSPGQTLNVSLLLSNDFSGFGNVAIQGVALAGTASPQPPTSVPEPGSTAGLIGLGLIGFGAGVKKKLAGI